MNPTSDTTASTGSESAEGTPETSPPRSPWIRPAPPTARCYPPVPARQGYIDAVGLFAVAFGAFAITAIVDCAHLLGAPDPAWRHGWNLNAISITAGALWWLAICWRGRESPRARPALLPMFLIAVGAASQIRSFVLPDELWDIAYTLTCGGLCLALAHRRGVFARQFGIAPSWAANARGRVQSLAVAVIAVAGNCASSNAQLHKTLPPGQRPAQQLVSDRRALTVLAEAGYINAGSAAGDFTVTVNDNVDDGQGARIDHVLFSPWLARLQVPGSYRVWVNDLGIRASDHRLVSVALRISEQDGG